MDYLLLVITHTSCFEYMTWSNLPNLLYLCYALLQTRKYYLLPVLNKKLMKWFEDFFIDIFHTYTTCIFSYLHVHIFTLERLEFVKQSSCHGLRRLYNWHVLCSDAWLKTQSIVHWNPSIVDPSIVENLSLIDKLCLTKEFFTT